VRQRTVRSAMMNKSKSVTIHDIAAQAGVSASTVSRVLNGTTPVADDKRTAVLAAIEHLNYRPNAVAQGLVRGKSSTIGVLTQDLAWRDPPCGRARAGRQRLSSAVRQRPVAGGP
jgi:DNA-binding LacI/PurR family transcriptional regulator